METIVKDREVTIDSLKKVYVVARLAQDKKAEDIKLLDMRGLSNFCDFFILLTAASSRRAQAIADTIKEGLHKQQIALKTQEGSPESGWLLLDLYDVVVHIFDAQARAFFNLDRLWADASVMEFPLKKNVSKQGRKPSQSTPRQNTK